MSRKKNHRGYEVKRYTKRKPPEKKKIPTFLELNYAKVTHPDYIPEPRCVHDYIKNNGITTCSKCNFKSILYL